MYILASPILYRYVLVHVLSYISRRGGKGVTPSSQHMGVVAYHWCVQRTSHSKSVRNFKPWKLRRVAMIKTSPLALDGWKICEIKKMLPVTQHKMRGQKTLSGAVCNASWASLPPLLAGFTEFRLGSGASHVFVHTRMYLDLHLPNSCICQPDTPAMYHGLQRPSFIHISFYILAHKMSTRKRCPFSPLLLNFKLKRYVQRAKVSVSGRHLCAANDKMV